MFKSVMKDNPALSASGARTVYGDFDKGDTAHLAAAYPRVGQAVIERIASVVNAPRLLEVTTILEVASRYLEGSFSQIRGLAIQVAANPLSILFWNHDKGCVQRIKTRESELMHGACEKLALRTDGIAKVNQVLFESHGLRLAFGCSCCAIVVHDSDAQTLFSSEYYRNRETFGRIFDSDVLCVSGDLLAAESVADVPTPILASSADFHQEEVDSYLRFARVNEGVVAANPISPHLPIDSRLVEFLKGNARLAA